MEELKTKKTTASVAKFIDVVKDDQQRKDAKTLLKMKTRRGPQLV